MSFTTLLSKKWHTPGSSTWEAGGSKNSKELPRHSSGIQRALGPETASDSSRGQQDPTKSVWQHPPFPTMSPRLLMPVCSRVSLQLTLKRVENLFSDYFNHNCAGNNMIRKSALYHTHRLLHLSSVPRAVRWWSKCCSHSSYRSGLNAVPFEKLAGFINLVTIQVIWFQMFALTILILPNWHINVWYLILKWKLLISFKHIFLPY